MKLLDKIQTWDDLNKALNDIRQEIREECTKLGYESYIGEAYFDLNNNQWNTTIRDYGSALHVSKICTGDMKMPETFKEFESLKTDTLKSKKQITELAKQIMKSRYNMEPEKIIYG